MLKTVLTIAGVIMLAIAVLLVIRFMRTDSAITTSRTYQSGIYYRIPNLKTGVATLGLLGQPQSQTIELLGVDFDMTAEIVVTADNDTLIYALPNGRTTRQTVASIFAMARPALSLNGRLVAVQATETGLKAGADLDPANLGIFVIDRETGTVTRVSPAGIGRPAESPAWFHQTPKLAYSTFSAETGVDIHIYDFAARQETLVIPDAGWLHVSIAPNDAELLVPVTMRIYDLQTGQLTADLKSAVLTALAHTDFDRDTIATGDFDNFPLDGDFSSDGQFIVFDGAVRRNNQPGMVIGTIRRDSTNAQIISDFIPINPADSNQNNFSQLNPIWL